MKTIASFKDLPFKTYSAYLISKGQDPTKIAGDRESYLITTTVCDMTILFVVGVSEINSND